MQELQQHLRHLKAAWRETFNEWFTLKKSNQVKTAQQWAISFEREQNDLTFSKICHFSFFYVAMLKLLLLWRSTICVNVCQEFTVFSWFFSPPLMLFGTHLVTQFLCQLWFLVLQQYTLLAIFCLFWPFLFSLQMNWVIIILKTLQNVHKPFLFTFCSGSAFDNFW